MLVFVFFLMIRRPPRATRTDTSFPTRRSSDLRWRRLRQRADGRLQRWRADLSGAASPPRDRHGATRLPLEVRRLRPRSEEHTSELQSLMRISYAVFCLKKKK